jgi:hypothetical protein
MGNLKDEGSHDNSWQAPPIGDDPPPHFADREEVTPVAGSSNRNKPAHDIEGSSPVQTAQQEFPSVGEIPVANVSPMTAHVCFYWNR